MGWFKRDPLQIIAFQTYGTSRKLYIKGRALEDEDIDLSKKNIYHLIINSWKRFETDEVGNAKVELKLSNGFKHQFKTDKEGYFLEKIKIVGSPIECNEEGWLAYELSFVDTELKREIQLENRFPGEMLVPSSASDFGVISDIDDTILHTGIVSLLKWRVIYNTLFKTPGKRLPLTGAAEFYHLLHRGKSGKASNPIFYVSNSPWNLYRYLEFFLRNNNFPKGPILLRSLSSFFKKPKIVNGERLSHKPHEILNILKMYPELSFILIGDSGEKDADIYLDIAQRFPDRIKAIYLRSVAHRRRMLRVKSLFTGFKTVPVLFVENSDEAIIHARAEGFIR
ncbi:App1 family protein [Arenibacter latericius]|uniref:App1 family protein n=1 Tax=Arenibacter latericius TaxID=86104 RepID=UPI00047CF733|nr:phosphatase domain-containing protein [Arenibacter latericius]MDX1362763.1 phosphatase domain-containing protein [Arenibacter latericius]